MESKLVISKGTELLIIPIHRLVYISADGNYSNAITLDGRRTLISYQLGQIEDMIDAQLGDDSTKFIRLGRGLIINMDFVYQVDTSRQRIVLSDCDGCYHELAASKDVLVKLKAYIEATLRDG